MINELRYKTKTMPRLKEKLFTYSVIIIMLKSMLFLSTLHTENSAGISITKAYFSPPPFISHIMMVVILTSFGWLFKGRKRILFYIIIDFIISLLLVCDLWYYRTNGNFLSIRFLYNNELFNPMKRNIFAVHPIDILFFIDALPIAVFIKKSDQYMKVKRNIKAFCISLVFPLLFISLSHYLIDKVDITKGTMMMFKNSWAPFQTMSNLSPLGYHAYDIYRKFAENNRKPLSDEDKKYIKSWFEKKQESLPDNEYKAMFKGKNLIAIQVESLENFVIGQSVEGQEITPNLNRLLNNSLYFNNIYEQNNNGTSSDADLLINTSLFPVREGVTFFRYPYTEYNSLPKLLNDMGYSTISTHAEIGGNWNWAEVHRASLGFQTIIDENEYKLDDLIRGDLSDGSLFKQFEGKYINIKQPFYSYSVTLSSHGPFNLPEKYKYLKLSKELNSTILGDYFQSVRYVDEQINNYLLQLNKDGLLENSIVIIYGDHTGVHKFYNDRLKDVKLEGNWWQTDDKKIPFIIYNPSLQGRKIETIGGHIDIMPTVAYMLGVEEEKFKYTAVGKILVKTNKNFTVLNNGKIIGNTYSEEDKENMLKGIKISDMIIKGDYFKN